MSKKRKLGREELELLRKLVSILEEIEGFLLEEEKICQKLNQS